MELVSVLLGVGDVMVAGAEGFSSVAGSGKSIVGEYMRKKGFPIVRFGQIVIDEVARLGLKINPESEKLARIKIRSEYGMAACATLSVSRVHALLHDNEIVVIDGLYSFSEYRELRREFGNSLVVIAVFTPRDIRYERLAARNERPLTRSEAVSRDTHEIESVEKGGPIAIADHLILNNKSEKWLEQQIEELLNIL